MYQSNDYIVWISVCTDRFVDNQFFLLFRVNRFNVMGWIVSSVIGRSYIEEDFIFGYYTINNSKVILY